MGLGRQSLLGRYPSWESDGIMVSRVAGWLDELSSSTHLRTSVTFPYGPLGRIKIAAQGELQSRSSLESRTRIKKKRSRCKWVHIGALQGECCVGIAFGAQHCAAGGVLSLHRKL